MNTFKGISNTKFILSGLLLLAFISSGYYQAMPDSGPSLSDSQKAEILIMYAPQVRLSGESYDHQNGEVYFPSPVEFSFQHNARIWEPEGLNDNWWLYAYEDFEPGDHLDYFHGCDGNPCRLADVPVYAFWDQVNDVPIGGGYYDVVDLIYFLWYPFNRGKKPPGIDLYFGNHVGDWEHVSIRLIPDWGYVPYQLYLSQHSGGDRLFWDEIDRVESTHPVVYAAWGSHGNWPEPGIHFYEFPFYDECMPGGFEWNTWDFVEAYDYDSESGLTGNAWPTWMGRDWDNPELGYTNPASGPIYKWGDREAGYCDIYCERIDGPTGPIDKEVWDVLELH